MSTSKHSGHRFRRYGALFIVVLLLGSFVGFAVTHPLPNLVLQTSLPDTKAQIAVTLGWPAFGQSAIGAVGYGVLSSVNDTTPASTASIAKIITTLCVLQKYPLKAGENGPTLTMTDADVTIYNNYIANDGSAVQVQAGEQLTEYQMLQGLLLPSANNLADSLATWAFGSLSAYTTYANQFVASQHLTNTHVGSDASGFNPDTTSTASDLVKLGELAIQQPAITDIAAQPTAQLPVVGTVYNYNGVLGTAGINGLKTGNSDSDLGAFLFTAKVPVGNTSITVVGAIMNGPSLKTTLLAAPSLVQTAGQNFAQQTIIAANSQVGWYDVPWQGRVPVVAQKTISAVTWSGQQVKIGHTDHAVDGSAPAGYEAAEIGVSNAPITGNSTTLMVLKQAIKKPSLIWRLEHAFSKY